MEFAINLLLVSLLAVLLLMGMLSLTVSKWVSVKMRLVVAILFYGGLLLVGCMPPSEKAALANTRFAPGFDEARFNAVRTGMSLEHLIEKLGLPLFASFSYESSEGFWITEPSQDQLLTVFTEKMPDRAEGVLQMGLLSYAVAIDYPKKNHFVYWVTVSGGSVVALGSEHWYEGLFD